MTKTTDWIQTYTGARFYPLEPDADLIRIEDIAHSLSMQCRYTGHTARFYSVAEHSLILANEFHTGWHYRLVALLHDAAEAYLSDIPRPLKRLPEFAFYREAEDRLQEIIFDKFCKFRWQDTIVSVKKSDALLLAQECHVPLIMAGCEGFDLVETHGYTPNIQYLQPEAAERAFVAEYTRLSEVMRERTATVAI